MSVTTSRAKNRDDLTNKIVAREQVKNSDATVLMNRVRDSIAKMNGIFDVPYRTNGAFLYSPQGLNKIDIHNQSSIEVMIEILGFLIMKSENYNKAAELLGLKKYPSFKWCGYTLELWQFDIQKRIAIIENSCKRKELMTIEKELTSLLSQSDKLSILEAKLSTL